MEKNIALVERVRLVFASIDFLELEEEESVQDLLGKVDKSITRMRDAKKEALSKELESQVKLLGKLKEKGHFSSVSLQHHLALLQCDPCPMTLRDLSNLFTLILSLNPGGVKLPPCTHLLPVLRTVLYDPTGIESATMESIVFGKFYLSHINVLQKAGTSSEFKRDLEMLLQVCDTMIPLDEPQKNEKVDLFLTTCLSSLTLATRLRKDGATFLKWLVNLLGNYPWAENTLASHFPRVKVIFAGRLDRDSTISSELSFID